MKKTKTEMLSEVISNITSKGRCMVTGEQDEFGACLYWNESLGYGCAIGNFLKPEYQTDKFAENNLDYVKPLVHEQSISILKPEYQTEDLIFLTMLQDLHDGHKNWTLVDGNLSLSDYGEENVDVILNHIEESGDEL